MVKKMLVVLMLIFSLGNPNLVAAWQDAPQPLSRQELVAMLKQTDAGRMSQAEIATEIERRGINFTTDDKTLAEFQKLGAKSFLLDVIRRAPKGPVAPRPEVATVVNADPADPNNPNPVFDEEARKRAEAELFARLPLLEQAKRHALEYERELPDFITTQVVKRYMQTPDHKDWKLVDTLEIELTYSSQKGEQFKVLKVDGKPTKLTYEEVGGSTSSGEFGSLLAALFLPQTRTQFREVKKEVFNGKQTVVYDFTVKKVNSTSRIGDRNSGKTIIAGYSGSIWIDTDTKRVLRIESANEGMPADFPITLSENAVEYEWVKIEGEPYLLPVRAELILGRDSERFYTRNVIEFRNYKKFEAAIKIGEDKDK